MHSNEKAISLESNFDVLFFLISQQIKCSPVVKPAFQSYLACVFVSFSGSLTKTRNEVNKLGSSSFKGLQLVCIFVGTIF